MATFDRTVPPSFPLRATGASFRRTDDGTVEIVNPRGAVIGVIPQPVMWDSSVDPASGAPVRGVPVAMEVTGHGSAVELRLRPDPAFLSDPATTYPVTIDPSGSVHEDWTTDHSTITQLRLGFDGAGKTRSFLQFNSSNIKGKHVLSAQLKLWNLYAGACAKSWEVWHTGGASTATRWSNQPGWYTRYATTTATKGATGCADGWVTQDVTSLMQFFAGQSTVNVVMGVWATSETDLGAYKAFNSGEAAGSIPTVEYTYNSYAATPFGRSVAPCSAVCSGTVITNGKRPALTGSADDADGGTLRLDFEIWVGHAGAPTTLRTSGSTSGVPAGQVVLQRVEHRLPVRSSRKRMRSAPPAATCSGSRCAFTTRS